MHEATLHGEPLVVIAVEARRHALIVLVVVNLVNLFVHRRVVDGAVSVQRGKVLGYHLRLRHLVLIHL